jgi:long-chain fatty acid transport protein
MKKCIVFLVACSLILCSAAPLYAGGADNKTNWSVEYIRTLNRNAATDSADIVMYNPAGTVKMDDGFYLNLSAHYIAKDYNNKINGEDFDTDEPSVVPGLFSVYKKDRWAGYFGVSNVVGGGKVLFEKGNANTRTIGLGLTAGANAILVPATAGAIVAFGGLAGTPGFFPVGATATDYAYNALESQQLDAEQIGLGYTFGASYKINDMYSVALAARYVDTERDFSGTVRIGATTAMPVGVVAATGGTLNNTDITAGAEFHESADGWGGVLGLNITPNDQVNIGLRFDTKVDLDFSQTIAVDTHGVLGAFGVTDGGTRTRNLPAVLAFGVSYQLNPKIRLETNFTYYMNRDAGFEDIPGTERDESAVDNGFDLGLAFEYAFTETVKGSVGYLYTQTGVDAKDMTPELPELDANTLGAGVVWEVIPNLDLNFAIGQVFYDSASFTNSVGDNIEYEKDITFLGFGVQYRFGK